MAFVDVFSAGEEDMDLDNLVGLLRMGDTPKELDATALLGSPAGVQRRPVAVRRILRPPLAIRSSPATRPCPRSLRGRGRALEPRAAPVHCHRRPTDPTLHASFSDVGGQRTCARAAPPLLSLLRGR
jgi:hypothetical protein